MVSGIWVIKCVRANSSITMAPEKIATAKAKRERNEKANGLLSLNNSTMSFIILKPSEKVFNLEREPSGRSLKLIEISLMTY